MPYKHLKPWKHPDCSETAETFRLYVNLESDAFADDPRPELARLLREIAARVETSHQEIYWFQTILDVNGNDVGRFAIKPVDYK